MGGTWGQWVLGVRWAWVWTPLPCISCKTLDILLNFFELQWTQNLNGKSLLTRLAEWRVYSRLLMTPVVILRTPSSSTSSGSSLHVCKPIPPASTQSCAESWGQRESSECHKCTPPPLSSCAPVKDMAAGCKWPLALFSTNSISTQEQHFPK